MELTSDLTGIQSIISECERQGGELAKIHHEHGNKATLDLIVNKVKLFLVSKKYISELNDIIVSNDKPIENIILFLILNTRYENESIISSINEYAHLINIMPKLSKFILMYLIIDLNWTDFFSKVAVSLPTQLIPELFEDASDNLSRKEGSEILKHVKPIVHCLINKVSGVDIQDNRVFETVHKLNTIVGKLLMNLTIHPSVSMPTASESECAIQIGYTLHTLLKFLLQVNEENLACGRIVDALILTSSTVTQQVTVSIYCDWAEVKEENVPFQYLIGTEAYRVMERYMKFKPAAQLLSLLSCMAKKPKTLSEIISDASLEDIIANIRNADANQRRWFGAFLNKPFFDEDTSRQCLQNWSTLCTVDDVVRILNQALNKNDDCKRLAMSCAKHLSNADISTVITRFFWAYEPWKQYTLNPAVEEPLILLLNKIHHQEELSEATIKAIQLLLLEHPQKVISMLFKECIKSDAFLQLLEPVFQVQKVAINLNNVPLDILREILQQGDFSVETMKNMTTLFKGLLRVECVNMNRLYIHVLKPLCILFQQQQDLAKLDFSLQILQELPGIELSDEMKEELAIFVLTNLENYRVKYTAFSAHKIGICTASINIIRKLCSHLQDLPGISDFCQANVLSKMNSYYLTWANETSCPSFLNYAFSSFASDNYGQMISKLIKISSRCILSEWLLITEDLAASLGLEKALEALTDSIILICEVTRTQTSDNVSVYAALCFYLANYGICIQQMRDRDTSQQFEILIIKNTCRLIKMLPLSIKYQEGLGLISLLNETVLKSLSRDKQFVCSLAQLEDSKLSQIIAKKMLN